jgi:hypothetical protein
MDDSLDGLPATPSMDAEDNSIEYRPVAGIKWTIYEDVATS